MMKKTIIVTDEEVEINSDFTDIILVLGLKFFTLYVGGEDDEDDETEKFIKKYHPYIKCINCTRRGSFDERYLTSRCIIIDDNYLDGFYIDTCKNTYGLLTKDGYPVLINKFSMISLDSYRKIVDFLEYRENPEKYLKALELWDQVVQFPEFLPKLDQIQADCRFLFRE